jgi:hypothetical protein
MLDGGVGDGDLTVKIGAEFGICLLGMGGIREFNTGKFFNDTPS